MNTVELIISKFKNKPSQNPDFSIDIVNGEPFSCILIRSTDFTVEKVASAIKDVLHKLRKSPAPGGSCLAVSVHFKNEDVIHCTAYYSHQENYGNMFNSFNDSVWHYMPVLKAEIDLFYTAFEFLRTRSNVEKV